MSVSHHIQHDSVPSISHVCRDHGPMRRLVVIFLLLSLGAYVTPGLAATASELIQKGYARDLKRCKAKWQALLRLCQAHPDPTLETPP
jgi:hypothetical protein